jgi:hypothetical protein
MAVVAGSAGGGLEPIHVAAATLPPTSASNQLFGVHPVEQGSTTLPGGHFNFAMVPGQSISDGMVVENLSDHPLTVHVYGADLLTAAGGGLAPAQPTTTMHQVGAWITVSAPTVTIPAHSQLTDDFTVALPDLVSPGEHLGAVVASADAGRTQQGNSIEARTALITVVTVPGTAHPSARLNPLSGSTATSGQIGFGITLSNTGNVLLTYAGSVAIDDGHGHRIATLPLAPTNAYVVPNGRVPLAVVWKDASPPSEGRHALATVTILADGAPVGTLTSQSLALPFSSEAPILLIVGIGLALVGALVLAWWVVRREIRRRRSLVIAGNALARRLASLP